VSRVGVILHVLWEPSYPGAGVRPLVWTRVIAGHEVSHMSTVTHSARIVGPIKFQAPDGHNDAILVGPCLIEELDLYRYGIFWGRDGEESAVLMASQVESAESSGKLVLLD